MIRGRTGHRAGPPWGRGARVGLRPEHITAHSAASGGVSATVVTKMYLGHQIQIVGRLANGAELIVRESRESCDPGLDTVDTGDAIELRWGAAGPTAARRVEERHLAAEEEPMSRPSSA